MPITLQPLDAAVEALRRKTPVASPLRTDGWDRVALGLRDRAQFSAGVESARVLAFIQDRLDQVLSHARTDAGTLRDRSEFVRNLMQLTRDEGISGPGAEGTIADVQSEARADLIYRMQTEQAYGYANWQSGQDQDALDVAPAQELVRFEARKQKRNWIERWRAAGGRVFSGDGLDGGPRLVALKTDSVWRGISRFGTPWPPYDFGSGVGVRDVLRHEAEEIGLIQEGSPPPQPIFEDFNRELQVDGSGLGDDGTEWLRQQFGDQVRVGLDGQVQWLGSRVKDYVRRSIAGETLQSLRLGVASKAAVDCAAEAGVDIEGRELILESDTVRKVMRDHGQSERRKGQSPLTLLDLEMIPHVWRSPDSVVRGDLQASGHLTSALFRKRLLGTLVMVEHEIEGSQRRIRIKSGYKKASP